MIVLKVSFTYFSDILVCVAAMCPAGCAMTHFPPLTVLLVIVAFFAIEHLMLEKV